MPKTSMEAKEARRSQILDAAVRCFARRGYYETTIEDLVTETGLSRGALYLYYPSKEALYLAISERWGCGLEEAIRARLTPDLSPASILLRSDVQGLVCMMYICYNKTTSRSLL